MVVVWMVAQLLFWLSLSVVMVVCGGRCWAGAKEGDADNGFRFT